MADVHSIYNVLKNQSQPPLLSEEEIKKANSDRNEQSVFVPVAMKNAYNRLSQDQKDHYKWYGEQYYNRIIDTVSNSIELTGKTLLLSVRSGLNPCELDDDELVVLRSVHGDKWYLEAGLTDEEYHSLMEKK